MSTKRKVSNCPRTTAPKCPLSFRSAAPPAPALPGGAAVKNLVLVLHTHSFTPCRNACTFRHLLAPSSTFWSSGPRVPPSGWGPPAAEVCGRAACQLCLIRGLIPMERLSSAFFPGCVGFRFANTTMCSFPPGGVQAVFLPQIVPPRQGALGSHTPVPRRRCGPCVLTLTGRRQSSLGRQFRCSIRFVFSFSA